MNIAAQLCNGLGFLIDVRAVGQESDGAVRFEVNPIGAAGEAEMANNRIARFSVRK